LTAIFRWTKLLDTRNVTASAGGGLRRLCRHGIGQMFLNHPMRQNLLKMESGQQLEKDRLQNTSARIHLIQPQSFFISAPAS
jgi:hypothetical protein